MAESKRITVRLGSEQVALVERYRHETGRDVSTVVRNALQDFFNRCNEPRRLGGSASTVQRQMAVHTPPPATSTLAKSCQTAPVKAAIAQSVRVEPEMSSPPSIAALVPQSRGLGAELQKVRRTQFQRVLAATFVALENGESVRDAQLYAELLRLGHAFGLLA